MFALRRLPNVSSRVVSRAARAVPSILMMHRNMSTPPPIGPPPSAMDKTRRPNTNAPKHFKAALGGPPKAGAPNNKSAPLGGGRGSGSGSGSGSVGEDSGKRKEESWREFLQRRRGVAAFLGAGLFFASLYVMNEIHATWFQPRHRSTLLPPQGRSDTELDEWQPPNAYQISAADQSAEREWYDEMKHFLFAGSPKSLLIVQLVKTVRSSDLTLLRSLSDQFPELFARDDILSLVSYFESMRMHHVAAVDSPLRFVMERVVSEGGVEQLRFYYATSVDRSLLRRLLPPPPELPKPKPTPPAAGAPDPTPAAASAPAAVATTAAPAPEAPAPAPAAPTPPPPPHAPAPILYWPVDDVQKNGTNGRLRAFVNTAVPVQTTAPATPGSSTLFVAHRPTLDSIADLVPLVPIIVKVGTRRPGTSGDAKTPASGSGRPLVELENGGIIDPKDFDWKYADWFDKSIPGYLSDGRAVVIIRPPNSRAA